MFAPITGAWIETYVFTVFCITYIRTHHGCVDWNFTYCSYVYFIYSHPSRVRGLKLLNHTKLLKFYFAPITGAWIETTEGSEIASHLCSHPSRVRGLKRHVSNDGGASRFAPITGAWIETWSPKDAFEKHFRTHHGCVDWNHSLLHFTLQPFFAPITGAWIETPQPVLWSWSKTSHPSRVRGLKQLCGWSII